MLGPLQFTPSLLFDRAIDLFGRHEQYIQYSPSLGTTETSKIVPYFFPPRTGLSLCLTHPASTLPWYLPSFSSGPNLRNTVGLSFPTSSA